MNREKFFSWQSAVIIGLVLIGLTMYITTDLSLWWIAILFVFMFAVSSAIKNGRS